MIFESLLTVAQCILVGKCNPLLGFGGGIFFCFDHHHPFVVVNTKNISRAGSQMDQSTRRTRNILNINVHTQHQVYIQWATLAVFGVWYHASILLIYNCSAAFSCHQVHCHCDGLGIPETNEPALAPHYSEQTKHIFDTHFCCHFQNTQLKPKSVLFLLFLTTK